MVLSTHHWNPIFQHFFLAPLASKPATLPDLPLGWSPCPSLGLMLRAPGRMPTSQRAWEDAPGWKTLGLFWSFVSSDCSFPSTKSASPNQIKDPQNIWVSVVPNYTIGGKLQTFCKSCKWALKRSYDGMPLAVEVVVYVDSSWP